MDKLNNLEPPCKPDEILALSFSFENLQKYINFLTTNDKNLSQSINDICTKLAVFEEFKGKINEIEYKMDSFFNKFFEIENSLAAHQNMFHEIQTNFINVNKKNDDLEAKIHTVENNFGFLENGLTELKTQNDDIKQTNLRMAEAVDKLKLENDEGSKKFEGISQSLNTINNTLKENENKFNDVNDKIEANMNKAEKKINEVKTTIEQIQRKAADSDNMLIKLIDSVSDLTSSNNTKSQRRTSGLFSSLTMGAFNQNNSDANNPSVMQELNKSAKEIEDLKKENKTLGGKVEELVKKEEYLEIQINDLNNKLVKIQEIQKEYEEGINTELLNDSTNNLMQNTEHNFNHNKDLLAFDKNLINGDVFNDNISKINENIKILSQNLGRKAGRDDVDKLSHQLKIDIQRLTEKVTENYKHLETKIKSSSNGAAHHEVLESEHNESHNASHESNNTNTFSFSNKNIQETFEKISKEIIAKEVSSSLPNSEYIKDIQHRLQSEIDRLFENFVQVKTALEETTPPIESNLKESISRIEQIEKKMGRITVQLNEVSKNLDGEIANEEGNDENNNNENDQIKKVHNDQNGSLKDYVKTIGGNLKHTNERLEKVANKQENMNAEILAQVKKNLSGESNRILEDFKQDLKTSISKIEDQLREKVDRFNLDEFGRRFDYKLNNEMNKKLDRNDLKRNNNMIHKKIDTLENKISKTLVDTLIDLQMEEAPLIIKKSMNGEKCASCNQFLPPHVHLYDNNYDNRATNKPSKFANIFKQGGDSNGKFYNYNHPMMESIDDSANSSMTNQKKVLLPEINSSNTTKQEFNRTNYRKKIHSETTRSPLSKNDDERNASSLIDSELEKRYINPNELMKTVNKAHELKMGK